jgi:hypothetical protein
MQFQDDTPGCYVKNRRKVYNDRSRGWIECSCSNPEVRDAVVRARVMAGEGEKGVRFWSILKIEPKRFAGRLMVNERKEMKMTPRFFDP